MKKKYANILLFIMLMITFFVMYYATVRSPICGDGYNYALKGNQFNAISLAFAAYSSWNGRCFSEFWGFFMCPRIELWNILNPVFFVIIFASIAYIIYYKKYPTLKSFCCFFTF